MKTLTPTNLIAVEVPKDAKIGIDRTEPKFLKFTSESEDIRYDGEHQMFYEHVGCDFEIIGEVTDTEFSFDIEPYLETYKVKYHEYTPRYVEWFEDAFKMYDDEAYTFDSDKAFRSLLQANELYFKNPMKEPMMHQLLGESENPNSEEKEWQSYESKLIKGKLIILKRI